MTHTNTCAHTHREIVGVNERAGEVLLRCTERGCYQRARIAGQALDVATVTTESLRTWRPYLKATGDDAR